MPRPVRILSVALAAVCAAAALPLSPVGASAPIRVVPEIGVEVLERFGIDADDDGRIDIPNTAAYVHGHAPGSCRAGCAPAAFPVMLNGGLRLMGAESDGLGDLPIVRYDWLVWGPAIAEPVAASGPIATVRLPEGDHWVELAVSVFLPFGSVRFRTASPLRVDDVLVVAIGDSYASGEGNPERHRAATGGEAVWAGGVADAAVDAAHARAHRSAVGWPARVALALEDADEESSVTFVSVAATSASIGAGVLGPQPGKASQSQLDQVAALVGQREIDLLLVSIGGNDIGFSRIVEGLVDADPLFDPVCYSTDLDNLWASARDGDWNRTSSLALDPPFGLRCTAGRTAGEPVFPGLDGLPAELDRMAAAVAEQLWVDRLVVAEYPDPTGRPRTGGDDICGEIVGDTFPGFRLLEIDRAEQEEGRRRVIEPLNEVLEAAAARHGWTYAGGVADAFFDGHGYCADWPSYDGGRGSNLRDPDGWYRNPGRTPLQPDPQDRVTSWFRTAAQSSALQGPAARYDTTGTLHPNELGHAAIAEAVLRALR